MAAFAVTVTVPSRRDGAAKDGGGLQQPATEGNANIGGDGRGAARRRIGHKVDGGERMMDGNGILDTPKKSNGRGRQPPHKYGRPVRSKTDDQAAVLSNTPPLAFSLRATSAYSARIWRRSESPVFASGIEIMLRPLR